MAKGRPQAHCHPTPARPHKTRFRETPQKGTKKKPFLWPTLKLLSLASCLIGLVGNAPAAQIDLLDAYTLAVTNSPEWAAQREQYAAQLKAVPLARSQLLPQIAADAQWSRVDYSGTTPNFSLDGDQIQRCTQNLLQPNSLTIGNSLDSLECLFTDETEPFTSTTIGLRMSQPIFRLDRWHQLKRSKSLATRAAAELEKAKQDLILETASTYFNVLKAKQALTVAENEQKALTRSLQLTQKRFERGLAKSAQVYEAQAQHDMGFAGLLTAQGAVSNALSALASFTHAEGIETTALPTEIPLALPQPEAPAEWARAAKSSSPELSIARMSEQMAQAEYRAKKALKSPTVDLFVSVTQTDAGGATPILDAGANTNTSIGVSFKMPLFTGGAITANINQAQHQRQALHYQVNALEHDISQRVISQYRNVQLAVNRAKAQNRAVSSTQKAHKAIARGHRIGSHTLSQLLQAQRSEYLARRDATNAQYDYVLETLRLKRAVGILDETDLQTLNAWLPEIPANKRASLKPANAPTRTATDISTHSAKRQPEKRSSSSFVDALRYWLDP